MLIVEAREAVGHVSHVQIFQGEEAKTRTTVKDAVAAYEWPAGPGHPAKLAQGVDAGCADGQRSAALDALPRDQCPRACGWQYVYSAHLLPELSTFVTPNRAQAHSVVPTQSQSLSGASALGSTLSLRYNLKHFFAFVQRRGDGTVVFGTSRDHPEWSQAARDSIVGLDDTASNQEAADSAARAFRKLSRDGASKASRHGEGADRYWSGIIATTSESVPMVGAGEGKEGQYITIVW